MNLLFSICFSLIFCLFVIKDYIKDKNKNDKYKKIKYICYFILIFSACFIRSINITKVPASLNYDEASIGYEAYSLLNYGIDRNGISLPVHFISWGSGQNVLYAYILIPFIKILGLTALSIRLPMLIISCFSIIIAYYLFKNLFKKYDLLALFIFCIIPWHIMKSRWGLESNIFPDIILLTIYFYNQFYNTKNKKYLYINAILLGISIYSYGTSYMFVPIYLILNLVFLLKKKMITKKTLILNILIPFIIALPILLFIIINYFNLDSIKIFNITIPKLYFNRFEDVTIVKNKNFYQQGISNFIGNLKLIFNMYDNNKLNSIKGIGVYYSLSIPFLLFGIYSVFKKLKQNPNYFIILSGIISGLLICFLVTPSIHRINCIWYFLIITIIIGITESIKYNKYFLIIIIFAYSLLFLYFIKTYFTDFNRIIYRHTNESYIESLNYIKNKHITYDKLIISNEINLPYIYYLLVFEVDPNTYLKTRKVKDMNKEFQEIEQIGNVYFKQINKIDPKNVYILSKVKANKLNIKKENLKCFKYYCVVH